MTGKYGNLSIAAPIECVIDKSYYPDDEANTSKKYMEYSVVVLTTKTVIPNVRQLVVGGGVVNGDYVVLQETTGTVDDPFNSSFDRKTTDSSKWNGDRVLVSFVGGNQNVPIIVGVLPHPATKYGGNQGGGKQRKVTWNGTTVLIDKDGNASITMADGATLQATAGQNSVKMSASELDLYADSSSHPMFLGDTFQNALNDLLTTMSTQPIAIFPTGAPSPKLIAACQTLQGLISGGTFNSKLIKHG
jgi:hypothetical protein